MSSNLLQGLSRELSDLRERSLLRELTLPQGIDFTSNDYLGLSRHPALAKAVLDALERTKVAGSGGSRLLRGNHAEHQELERFSADFFQTESALYFNSGFEANLALFSTLPSRRGTILIDEKVHASVKEGVRASFAGKRAVRHNDPQSFEDALRRARAQGARDLWIGVESVYSMDGDRAPLEDLLALARRFDAALIVDEAHATGIFGPTGRGLTEELKDPNLITLHTCGKALGVAGALAACNKIFIDSLINNARPFIFSTAPPPFMAAAVRRALALIDEEPWRRERLLRLIETAHRILGPTLQRWKLEGHGTPILPIHIGDESEALRAGRALRERGIDLRAIRPPTVPAGQSRLRLSLSVERTEEDLKALAAALQSAEKEILERP